MGDLALESEAVVLEGAACGVRRPEFLAIDRKHAAFLSKAGR